MSGKAWGALAVMVVGALIIAAPARAQNQLDDDRCADSDGKRFSAEERIDGCTKTIGSGRYRGTDLALAYNSRGSAWADKRDPDRAIADYSEAIRLDPKYARAYYNRGLVWGDDKGDRDRAIADYGEAIRFDPKMAFAYNNRGNMWKAKGDLDRAIADFTEAIRLDPKGPFAYNNRGSAWKAKGNLDRAIADFSEAIRVNPNYANAFYNRGLAWEKKSDLQKALADFKKYTALVPSDPDGRNAVASITKRLNGR